MITLPEVVQEPFDVLKRNVATAWNLLNSKCEPSAPSGLYTVCQAAKLLNNLRSIDEDDGWGGVDVAEDHEVPAVESWNRRRKNNRLDTARLEELANLLRGGQVVRKEARR